MSKDKNNEAASLPVQTAAARHVLAERRRQVVAEGWTPEHDDAHEGGELADAAAALILEAGDYRLAALQHWPWADAIKDAPPRRNLVKAGALVLAEIERLDRAAGDSSDRAENTPPFIAISAEIAPGTLPYPTEPTDALLDVLGLMLYTTTPIAHALRAAGTDIPKRCEDEQAHVLHWLIQLALQHGAEWRSRAAKSIEELQAATQATSEVRA